MRTRTLAASATLLLASSLAPAAPATAGAPTCHGHRATLVGHRTDLFGTMHRDVIVTNGADRVVARGGDDLICVTRGPAGNLDGTWVEAGSGDDLVDGRHAGETVFAALMGGRDTYVGGRYEDVVTTGGELPATVTTGGGSDVVASGSAVADRIHLGAGADYLEFDDAASPRGVFDGGPGVDQISIPDPVGRGVIVDAAARRATRPNGTVILSWRGFTGFDLRGTKGPSITFRGTLAPELVLLGLTEHRSLDLRLGGGDDRVVGRVSATGSILGGAGHDRLTLLGHGLRAAEQASAELARGALAVIADGTATSGPTIPGFEDLVLKQFLSASIVGTAGDNDLATYNACTASLTGGRGDDTLRATGQSALRPTDEPEPWDQCPTEPAPRLTARGGPGDDTLTGWFGDDELVGGAGRDTANGAGGDDRCEAETRENCETS